MTLGHILLLLNSRGEPRFQVLRRALFTKIVNLDDKFHGIERFGNEDVLFPFICAFSFRFA
ncbi:hypothetical protein BV917_06080 [Leptospira santarosai serovar Guaricura]|nr:hypothetical protein BV917_06080 [Leptospira santarosai serovar Guaricura]